MENYLNDFYYFKQACPKVATNIVKIYNYALGGNMDTLKFKIQL